MLTGKRENNRLEGLSWFISAALVHSPRPTFAIIIKKQTKKQKKKQGAKQFFMLLSMENKQKQELNKVLRKQRSSRKLDFMKLAYYKLIFYCAYKCIYTLHWSCNKCKHHFLHCEIFTQLFHCDWTSSQMSFMVHLDGLGA